MLTLMTSGSSRVALLSSWVMSAHRTTSLAEGRERGWREREIVVGERDSCGRERKEKEESKYESERDKQRERERERERDETEERRERE